MKKCFLLISIILISFGFSINSSIINNTFKNKNNDIKQLNSKNNEFNNDSIPEEDEEGIEIIWEDEDAHIPENLIVTPTTATIDYKYNNAPKLKKIIFLAKNINSGTEIPMQEIGIKEGEKLDNNSNAQDDYTYDYEGNIAANQNLFEGQTYHFAYLNAYDYNNNSAISTTNQMFQFTTPTFLEKGKFTTDISDTTTIENSATIDFYFKPSTAEYTDWKYVSNQYNSTSKKKNVQPLKVEWVDNGIDLLGSAEIDSETIEINDGIYHGEITTDQNAVKNNEKYTDTKLIIYDEFAENDTDKSKYKYESNFFDINANKDISSDTKIYSDEGPYSNSPTEIEESIDYKIEKSDDSIINEVSWKDESGKTFEGAIDKLNKKETGTLSTTDLTSGTEYNNTYLEVKTINKDNGNKETIESDHIYHFKTPQIGDVWGEVTKIKGASTTLKYTIWPPTAGDDKDSFLDITNIFWKEEHKPNGKPLAQDNSPTPSPNAGENTITGKLVAKDLPTRTLIENSYLEITYLNSSGIEETLSTTYIVPDFESGNFVTRDAILGAIALAIILVITIIISLLVYGYKKRRRVT